MLKKWLKNLKISKQRKGTSMLSFKKIIISSCLVFMLPVLSFSSESTYCEEEIAAEAIQLALTKADILILLEKMKKLDDEFKKAADLLDLKVMKTIDEGSNLARSTSTMQATTSSISTLVNTAGIVAKARLIYLKASILRFQFHASKLSSEELKDYNSYKKKN